MLSLLRARVQSLVRELGSHKLWSAAKKKKRFGFFWNINLEVGLLNHMEVLFLLFRYLHTVFHSGYTSLHSHHQSTRIPSPHPHQHLLSHLFDDRHSDRCEVISQNSFDLHFPNDYRC